MKWTLLHSFFRSLNLAHLERSIYSLSRQTVKPDEFLFFDNNTQFSVEEIKGVLTQHFAHSDINLHFEKHGDPAKTTASWCQNQSILRARNELFILTKADCIYDFTFCERLLDAHGGNPNRFAAAWMMQMDYYSETCKPHEQVDHAKDLEALNWREDPQYLYFVSGQLHDSPGEDAASFITTRRIIAEAGWYDEELRCWGFWQSDLQRAMRERGVEFVTIPEVLSWHMMHPIEGERDQQKGMEDWLRSSRRAQA